MAVFVSYISCDAWYGHERTSNDGTANTRTVLGVVGNNVSTFFAKDVYQGLVHPVGKVGVFLQLSAYEASCQGVTSLRSLHCTKIHQHLRHILPRGSPSC